MLTGLALPVRLSGYASVTIRRARQDDLDQLVGLLADDPISASRGDVAAPSERLKYASSLDEISNDVANDLVVATDDDDCIVGMLQLTRIPGLARRGATRLLVEAVRVSSTARSAGIGTAMMRWVMDSAAAELGADLVQLTSDIRRESAHRFYERLGFDGSHIGFKYAVPSRG